MVVCEEHQKMYNGLLLNKSKNFTTEDQYIILQYVCIYKYLNKWKRPVENYWKIIYFINP
jgi:hypothetical protein